MNKGVRATLAGVGLWAAAQAGAQTNASVPAGPAAAEASTSTPLATERTEDGAIVVRAPAYVPAGALTATKSDIPLIRTPQSVSVVSRDQIDLLNFVDTQQALRYVSGAFGESYGPDPRYDFVTVRGFVPRQFIDGLAVPASTSISSTGVDLYLFQSVDVLKGPSSALYGLAPPGGILNETSRRPSDSAGGELRAEGGTRGFGEIATTVTGPAAPFLNLRFTGLLRETDGNADHQHTRRALAAPSATVKLGPDTTLTGLLYYQYDQVRGGQGGFLPRVGTLDPNPNGRIGRTANLFDPADVFERRQLGAGYEFRHRFGEGVSFTSNTKWSGYHEATPVGLYDTGFTNTTDPTRPGYLRTVAQSNFTYKERVHSFATDNRLAAEFATGPVRHTLLAGVDYRNVTNVAADNFVAAGTINAFDPVYIPTFEQAVGYPFAYNNERLKQTGAYGQDQLGLGRFYLTLGGRYDWVRLDDRLGDTQARQHKFTYRIGGSYVSPSGLAPYVSYATSFEPVLGVDAATGGVLKPSAVHQWEGGLKYDGRTLGDDVRVFATLAAFDIRESNFVSPQVGITPVSVTQGGLVEVYGGEAELVARIHDRLTINAAYGYAHSKVLRAASEPADIGYRLPSTPKHKASLLVDYQWQRGALAGVGLGGGVRYTSRSTGALPGAFGTPVIYGNAATLFDAILSYDRPGWRFAVNASNLADKRYVARCASDYGCVYGAGRQVLGTVTRKF